MNKQEITEQDDGYIEQALNLLIDDCNWDTFDRANFISYQDQRNYLMQLIEKLSHE